MVYTEQRGRPSSWRVSHFAAAGISVSVTLLSCKMVIILHSTALRTNDLAFVKWPRVC